jgi:hypothetical protein
MARTLYVLSILLIWILIGNSCKKSETETEKPVSEQSQSFTVKGRLKTCTGTDVSPGLIVVLTFKDKISTGYYFDSVFTGSFSLNIQPAEKADSIAVFGVDLKNLRVSDTLKYKLQDTLININTLTVCGVNITEYLRFKVDNSTEQIYTPLLSDSLKLVSWEYPGGWPMTSFLRQCRYNCRTIELQFDGHSAGTFPVTGRNRIFIYNWYSFNMPATGSITYTSYGTIGQYVTGSMSVPFVDNTDSLNHILTGSFRLKRKG